MVKIKLDSGKEIEVSEDAAAAFKQVQEFQQAAQARADDAEAELLVTQNELATVKGAQDALKTRLDAIEGDSAKKKAGEDFRAQVREFSALVTSAKAILPTKDHARLDEMEPLEIMQAVIRADAGDPELKLDSAEPYIKGRYEQVLVSRSKGAKAADKGKDLGAKINESRADEAEGKDEGETPEEARDRKKKALTERYKSGPQAKK